MYVCTYVHVCMYLHRYIHMYVYLYTCTYTDFGEATRVEARLTLVEGFSSTIYLEDT